jgi:hypothetical protein
MLNPRIKNRPKGILIPIEDYTREPIYEDKHFKYMGALTNKSKFIFKYYLYDM